MPSQADDDRYFDLKGLSAYSGLSIRTLQRYMVDRDRPLPHHHLRAQGKERGRVLVKRSEFDAWVESFQPSARQAHGDTEDEMDRRVAAALKSMRG